MEPVTANASSLRHAFGGVLAFFILILIGVLAFSIRLFSVIKYESVIHEFDPYFNYRVTQYLTKNGIYDFWNWFDDRTWYPLGRVIGGTVYPGLTLTAGTIWWVLNSVNIPLSVETVCVFTAPVFSAFAAWATYFLTKEVKGTGAGLTAAVLLAMEEEEVGSTRWVLDCSWYCSTGDSPYNKCWDSFFQSTYRQCDSGSNFAAASCCCHSKINLDGTVEISSLAK